MSRDLSVGAPGEPVPLRESLFHTDGSKEGTNIMVRVILVSGLAFLTLTGFGLAEVASAKVVQYTGLFVEGEVIPPSGSAAIGFGVFTIDTEANTMSAVVSMEGIVGDAAPVIHGPAPPGESADAQFNLPEHNSISSGTWNYDESFEAAILSGLTYVDIHTEAFPGGELRGQILEDCGAGRVNLASGSAQEVLQVDGDPGVPGCREVNVSVGVGFTFSCDASNGGPAAGRYILWGWVGQPQTPTEVTGGGNSVGCLANPIPLTGGSPQPFRCLNGGMPLALCGPVPSVPAPSRVPFSVVRAAGIGVPLTVTLQGIVEDDGAANPLGFSTTNMVVLVID